MFDQFRKPSPKDATACQPFWEPPQGAQESKRRVLWGVDEIAPIAVLGGPAPGYDRRYARGTIAEHGSQPLTIRRKISNKRGVFDDFPPAGINKNEQGEQWFHAQ